MSTFGLVCKGRGRGVLALTSFEPLPKPIITNTEIQITTPHQQNPNPKQFEDKVDEKIANQAPQQSESPEKKPINVVKPWENKDKEEVTVLAKYAYKANPSRPGGFDELSITVGEKLTLLRKGHAETKNPHWCEVKNSKGEIGYVGASYLQVLEQTPSALPWLENKRLLEEKERKEKEKEQSDSPFGAPGPPKVKQYQSAYNGSSSDQQRATNADEIAKKYYCELCDKNLNGPQPYKMHMSSKAHREEMEYKGLL